MLNKLNKLNKFNRKDIINYSIIFSIFLVLLSSFDHSFNIKVLISFFLLSIIIYWLTNNIYKSVAISFIVTFIYYITNNTSYENFENQDLKVDDIVKELTNISDTINKDNNEDEDNEDKDNEKTYENLDQEEKKEITEDDIELFDDDDKTPTESNKYIESAKAQRETHRLINTIKQLQDTVEHLAPTLKQGATIINKFKKLNLINDQ
jgi:hypothetical protein